MVKRIQAEFTTQMSAPVRIMKLAAPSSWQGKELPPFTDGERVTRFDADGLEVEAVVTEDDVGQ